MSEQITLQVSDRVVNQATHIATQTQQRVEEVLANWLEWAVTEMPVEALSNEEVLALTELQLTIEQQSALSRLLAQNQDGTLILGLTSVGRATIDALRLNSELAVEVRRNWVLAGWHPPEEDT